MIIFWNVLISSTEWLGECDGFNGQQTTINEKDIDVTMQNNLFPGNSWLEERLLEGIVSPPLEEELHWEMQTPSPTEETNGRLTPI
jgi:hypothetical protein